MAGKAANSIKEELSKRAESAKGETKLTKSMGIADLIVNALLGCHDLVLSCCHEIARIGICLFHSAVMPEAFLIPEEICQ